MLLHLAPLGGDSRGGPDTQSVPCNHLHTSWLPSFPRSGAPPAGATSGASSPARFHRRGTTAISARFPSIPRLFAISAVVHLFILMQQNGRALLFRQRGIARRMNSARSRSIMCSSMRISRGRQFAAAPASSSSSRRVERNFHLPVPVVAHRIQRQIRRDAEEPGGELRARRILLPRAVHPQKNLLRQVLRRRRVPHHPVEEIDQRRTILLQQKSKDASSPAFTSSISWTSDLAMASTVYLTHAES